LCEKRNGKGKGMEEIKEWKRRRNRKGKEMKK